MFEPTHTDTIEWGPAHLREDEPEFDFTPEDN